MKTRKIVYTGLLAAMTFILTRIFTVPILGGYGYFHFGDSVVYLTVFLLGGTAGALVGGIGGALADLTIFPIYTVPTLIVKSAMALAAAYVYKNIKNKALGMAAAFICGGIVMILGYYITEGILYSNWITPFLSMPMNVLQVLGSVPIPAILTAILKNKKKI